jgi:F0F1-type ATP synthase delta subunit
MSTPLAFSAQVLTGITRANQLDVLYLAITNLLEMASAGELDLILDNISKTTPQRRAFVEKVISSVESPELRWALQEKAVAGELEFFRGRALSTTLQSLQREAEKLQTVKLHVAIDFKPADLKTMTDQLASQLGGPVVLDIQVEKAIIGGAIVQFGTAIRDYSVRTRLEYFRDHWKGATVEA